MVLVSYTLANYVSILQTQFSDREGHEARRGGLETMPLDQHIEGRHGAGEPRLKIGPAPMPDLCAMADERQHRAYRLHQQAVLPRAPLTHFALARIARRGMEARVAPDNQLLFALPDKPLQSLVC